MQYIFFQKRGDILAAANKYTSGILVPVPEELRAAMYWEEQPPSIPLRCHELILDAIRVLTRIQHIYVRPALNHDNDIYQLGVYRKFSGREIGVINGVYGQRRGSFQRYEYLTVRSAYSPRTRVWRSSIPYAKEAKEFTRELSDPRKVRRELPYSFPALSEAGLAEDILQTVSYECNSVTTPHAEEESLHATKRGFVAADVVRKLLDYVGKSVPTEQWDTECQTVINDLRVAQDNKERKHQQRYLVPMFTHPGKPGCVVVFSDKLKRFDAVPELLHASWCVLRAISPGVYLDNVGFRASAHRHGGCDPRYDRAYIHLGSVERGELMQLFQ